RYQGSPAGSGGKLGHPSPGFVGGLRSPQMPHGTGMSGVGQSHRPQSNTGLISRILPPRAWAAAVPTLLTQEAFHFMIAGISSSSTSSSAVGADGQRSSGGEDEESASVVGPLERFLGCMFLHSTLRRNLTDHQFRAAFLNVTTDAFPISFKTSNGELQMSFFLNAETCQSVALKVATEHPDRWPQEDTNAIEQFFEKRVATLPPRLVNIQAMLQMLACPTRLLKDMIKIMKLDLCPPPAPTSGMPSMNLPRWSVHWCLTIPSSAPPLTTPGICAIIPNAHKHLFFLQLTRLQPGEGPPSIVIPLLYDNARNGLSMPEAKHTAIVSASVHQVLKRLSDFGTHREECTLYPAVKELMMTLIVGPDGVLTIPQPTQGVPQMQMAPQQGMMGNQQPGMMGSQQMIPNQQQMMPNAQSQQMMANQQQQQMMQNPQQQMMPGNQQQMLPNAQQPMMPGNQQQMMPNPQQQMMNNPQQQQMQMGAQMQMAPQQHMMGNVQQQQQQMMGNPQQQQMQMGGGQMQMAPQMQMGGQMPNQQYQRMMHPRMPQP
ncbi:unnamed protein product, partial [Notodromas monacha]